MQKSTYIWGNIDEMFGMLHERKCLYLILRNYEEIDDKNFYISGHADIDFLVADSKKFSRTIHATPRFREDDGIHYVVNISGTDVVIDVRSVGDGYYDTRWQKKMLSLRKLYEQRFYIMDDENYYYSLIYHAILQKNTFADDYLRRLNKMAEELNKPGHDMESHLKLLNEFMTENHYKYTIPYDIWVPLNRKYIDKNYIYTSPKVHMRNVRQSMIEICSKVKHRVIGK